MPLQKWAAALGPFFEDGPIENQQMFLVRCQAPSIAPRNRKEFGNHDKPPSGRKIQTPCPRRRTPWLDNCIWNIQKDKTGPWACEFFISLLSSSAKVGPCKDNLVDAHAGQFPSRESNLFCAAWSPGFS